MKGLVLVTGANGFIGGHLCEGLRQAGFELRTLNRHAAPGDERSFRMDLARDPCPHGLLHNVDAIFHLAGKAHDLAGNDNDASTYHRINTEGTRKLLEAAKLAGVKRFIFFSSVKAVGESDMQAMNETFDLPAVTPYGRSKFEAEQLVLHGDYVPHPVVIRPAMVYGNTEKGNLSRMIKAIRWGLFPPLPEMHNRRSMVHVDDIVRAAILADETPQAAGQVYIVTDGHCYSTRQIYDWVRASLGRSPVRWAIPMEFLNGLAKVGDMIGYLIGRRFVFDSAALRKLAGSAWYLSDKIERELGFKANRTLPEALPDIIRFLKLK
ncbi:MAG: NAD-dependent epimerase/dehydratase family protein [Methylomonas sp.]|nr:NAD-dependent epimerase/dehydratase family protein [Methylomonas sp.]